MAYGTKSAADLIMEELDRRMARRIAKAGAAKDPTEMAIEAAKKAAKEKLALEKEAAKAELAVRRETAKQSKEIAQEAAKRVEQAQERMAKAQKKKADDDKKAADDWWDRNTRFRAGLTETMSKIGAVATSGITALTNFGGALSQFVGKANPAAVQRFTLAVDDMQAVIGQILLPVLEKVTILVRRLGNAILSLSGDAKQMIGGLTAGGGIGAVIGAVLAAISALTAAFGWIPLAIGFVVGAFVGVATTMNSGAQIGDAFSKVLGVIGRLIEWLARVIVPILATALEYIAGVIEMVGDVISEVANAINEALVSIGLDLFGSDAKKYDPNARDSTGAAVRQASFGSLSSFANKAYASAYGGASMDVPNKQLKELEDIRKNTAKMAAADDRASSAGIEGSVDRMRNPFERASDGKTNFGRGLENIRDTLRNLF